MNPKQNLFAEISSQVLEWIKLSPKYLFAIAFFTGSLLFSPYWILERSGLLDYIDRFRLWISLIFWLAFTLLATHSSISIFNKILMPFYTKVKEKKRLREWLHHLTPKQKAMLGQYLDENTRTLNLNFMDGEVKELVNANILYLTTGIVGMGYRTPYSISTWVWEYLQKHPDLLSVE